MENADNKLHECSVKELERRQELEHLLHLEKENAALKLENKQLEEEKQALLEENQRLNQIIEQLRDIEKTLSSEIFPNHDQPNVHGNVNQAISPGYSEVIWRQVSMNLEKQSGQAMPLQHQLALLMALNINNMQVPAQDMQQEP